MKKKWDVASRILTQTKRRKLETTVQKKQGEIKVWQEECRLSNHRPSREGCGNQHWGTFWKSASKECFQFCPLFHINCHVLSDSLQKCTWYWSSGYCFHPTRVVIPIPWAELSWLYKEGGNSARTAFGGRVAFCCIWNILLSFSLIFSPFDGSLQLERTQKQFQCRCK